MRRIRTMKRHDDRIVFVLGDEDSATNERLEAHTVPLAAVASWAALLGVSEEDALAAILRLDGNASDVAVPWPRLYDELSRPGSDPEAQSVAREAIGVALGAGLDVVSEAVQLQPGRLDVITDVLSSHSSVDTDMSNEDVALAVQLGDLRGKAQRYMASPAGVSAVTSVAAEVEGMRARALGDLA